MPAHGDGQPFLDVRDITRHVGLGSFARGQEYASSGAVLDTSWDPEHQVLSGHVRGTAREPYESRIRFRPEPGEVNSSCTCPIGGRCKHVAATLIRRNFLTVQERMTPPVPEEAAPSADRTEPTTPSWKTAVAALTTPGINGDSGRQPKLAPLGLLFEVREMGALRDRWRGASAKPADNRTPSSADLRLAVRPVMRSESGNWVRGQVNWSNVGHHAGRLRLNSDHQSWLGQIVALNRSSRSTFGYTEADWIYLDDLASPLLWPLLATAGEVGVELITGKKGTPVGLAREATIGIEVVASADDGTRGDLRVAPSVRIDGDPHAVEATRLIGDHGLYTFELDPLPRLTLAPAAEPFTSEQRQLLATRTPVIVPAEDAPEFLAEYYPKLRRTVPVTSPDASVELPEPVTPTLVLTASYSPNHHLKLEWGWAYGTTRAPLVQPAFHGETFRELVAEREFLERTRAALPDVAIVSSQKLSGIDAAEFTEKVLPRIREQDDVRVDIVGDQPDYRELTGAPTLSVSTVETDKRDWFDLGVMVTVDGKKVPFGPIFKALAKGHTKLLLVDGSYLSLKQPVFDELRDLLTEASVLDEWETGVRISRFQASLWADFEDLAEETQQAVAWRESVSGLLDLAQSGSVAATPLPAGINATLRPYQQEGFNWLAFLWEHDLGGVLADDMGLGKTLQTLALVAHAVSKTPEEKRRPFLVVAPTSVVSNWISETKRFAPDLVVAGITETERKSGQSVRDAAHGADLVITSYALFRLDFEGYSSVQWAGMVLDEAQFVKNAESKAHESA
ncbi:MAG: hypothetical protein JWR33_1355, partial [Naasia sp.]|uniref:SNF2-related protein n=1 Tax=Naasia sp. TaxID=2546198 RepID=UPI002636C90D